MIKTYLALAWLTSPAITREDPQSPNLRLILISITNWNQKSMADLTGLKFFGTCPGPRWKTWRENVSIPQGPGRTGV